jgi:HlyD family secretion protein
MACNSGDEKADASGNFEADEIILSAEANGKILSLPIEEGDEIAIGQTIAFIDTTQLYLQKGQLIASMSALRQKLQNVPDQLAVYEQQITVLERELKRIQSLKSEGAATEKQVDDLSGELSIVKTKKTAIESQLSTGNRSILSELEPLSWRLRQLEDAIERSVCKSPIDGIILKKYKNEGEITGQGQPLVKLANLESLTLRAFVTGDQLSSISLGQDVTVAIDEYDEQMSGADGTITWISAQAEFTPKTIQTRAERANLVYAIKIQVKNPGSLKIGMPAEVNFR